MPYLDHVPVGLGGAEGQPARRGGGAVALSRGRSAPVIVADWPEDIAQFCNLLMTGPGEMVPVPPLTFDFVPLGGFQHRREQHGAA